MKVIASSLRKGYIVEIDDKLYAILSAENIHPGKSTPVTQVDMRRLNDGVKSSLRFKTTDQVERAHVEEREYQYLYEDGDGFHFMNMESYDQIAVPSDVIGEQSVYLLPETKVRLSVYEGTPVGIELPQRAASKWSRPSRPRGQNPHPALQTGRTSNGVHR
jgi:elongation factor P